VRQLAAAFAVNAFPFPRFEYRILKVNGKLEKENQKRQQAAALRKLRLL